jgi:hypothetical protein
VPPRTGIIRSTSASAWSRRECWCTSRANVWTSCDARGNLRSNWRVIQAPRRLVDDLVVHELAHLVHPDHGREFSLPGRAIPDYQERREALRRLGRRLVWSF